MALASAHIAHGELGIGAGAVGIMQHLGGTSRWLALRAEAHPQLAQVAPGTGAEHRHG